jgi:hypothetical protein
MDGQYWDHNEARWMPSPAPPKAPEVPAQPTGLEAGSEADVRSG